MTRWGVGQFVQLEVVYSLGISSIQNNKALPVQNHTACLHYIVGEIDLKDCLHAAFHTSSMIAEGTAENSIKFIISLLGRWLCP